MALFENDDLDLIQDAEDEPLIEVTAPISSDQLRGSLLNGVGPTTMYSKGTRRRRSSGSSSEKAETPETESDSDLEGIITGEEGSHAEHEAEDHSHLRRDAPGQGASNRLRRRNQNAKPQLIAGEAVEEPLLSTEVLDDYGLPQLPIEKNLGEVVIELCDIRKSYDLVDRQEQVHALTSISLSIGKEFYPIRRGEFVMLRGPSGGGKTSLLNILGTIDRPSGGTIEILGSMVDSNSSDDFLARLRLEKIGFVFQTFNLLSTMSAYENVELPMTILGKLGRKERRKRTKELLTAVGLRDRMKHLPSELSGGEQQRVTIARSLANEPEILLLDEPTGDLDTKNTIEIMDLLLEINQRHNTTCVMVTHNPDIECYADRLLYVSDGRFVAQALNYQQTKLDYPTYIRYLNEKEN
eukprot:CAMPEP_0174238424 /NCGR_PEP_ID=MMETSP0417-20130205/11182_1 /TAXON_ID=242541 /ORGANISM="Mayorella sp, Strain BSH-02190019" /LENGTH=409 /DNA_ID=CAMNT_0015317255 /DNA_START=106 /DNA_END=1332 /DNA_ORIENTATION=+